MIKAAFAQRKSLFIPFIMSGYPSIEESNQALLALASIGADIIEIGVPFSDPIADGVVNQMAAEGALKNGVCLDKVFAQVQAIRAAGCTTPLILFSYFNPILAFGEAAFVAAAIKAGVNGVLIVDLPPEEGYDFYCQARKAGLELVLLASPTTDRKRLDLYQRIAPSFIYYISRLGVTGIQQQLSDQLEEQLLSLKRCLPEVKLAVGFGISSLEQARTVSSYADAVIVGSSLIKILAEQGPMN